MESKKFSGDRLKIIYLVQNEKMVIKKIIHWNFMHCVFVKIKRKEYIFTDGGGRRLLDEIQEKWKSVKR